MTELELYQKKLIEALCDKEPIMLLRRIRNNATSAVALAEANSILTESDKLLTTLKMTDTVLTSASKSTKISRALSYICLKEFANIYKYTTAYTTGLIDESCKLTRNVLTTDKDAIKRLRNLSEYLRQNVLPLLTIINESTTQVVKQHAMRQIIFALDKIKPR